MARRTHWLKGKGKLSWAAFQVDSDTVRVIALIGCASYIDRDMNMDEARRKYRELTECGWAPQTPPTEMTIRMLRMHIYD